MTIDLILYDQTNCPAAISYNCPLGVGIPTTLLVAGPASTGVLISPQATQTTDSAGHVGWTVTGSTVGSAGISIIASVNAVAFDPVTLDLDVAITFSTPTIPAPQAKFDITVGGTLGQAATQGGTLGSPSQPLQIGKQAAAGSNVPAIPAGSIRVALDASRSQGTGLSYSWSVSPVSPQAKLTTATPAHLDLTAAGTYTIALTVTDSLARQNTATGTVVVSAIDPNVVTDPHLVWPFLGGDGSYGEPTMSAAHPGYQYSEGDHVGDDYFAQDWSGAGVLGKQVISPISGTVLWAGGHFCNGCTGGTCVPNPDPTQTLCDYGINVIIGNGQYAVRMGHLEQTWVKTGDPVCEGSPIGKLGSTGNSTGPHLHLVEYFGLYQTGTNGIAGILNLAGDHPRDSVPSSPAFATGRSQFAQRMTPEATAAGARSADFQRVLRGCPSRGPYAVEVHFVQANDKGKLANGNPGVPGVRLSINGDLSAPSEASGRLSFTADVPSTLTIAPLNGPATAGCVFSGQPTVNGKPMTVLAHDWSLSLELTGLTGHQLIEWPVSHDKKAGTCF